MCVGDAADAAPPYAPYLGYEPPEHHPARTRTGTHAREEFTGSKRVQGTNVMTLGAPGPSD
jgi:hypothetical protein